MPSICVRLALVLRLQALPGAYPGAYDFGLCLPLGVGVANVGSALMTGLSLLAEKGRV